MWCKRKRACGVDLFGFKVTRRRVESGQGSRDVSCCEVVEDSKDDWTDCFVSLFRLVLNFSYTNVFGLEFWKGFGLWFWIFTW